MPNTNGGQRNDLDEQILDEVRRGPRTQDELAREVGEAESKIRSRLQFLDSAGYVEQNESTGEYELRDDPEKSHLFEEHPRLQWVAFGAVFLLFGALYVFLFSMLLEPVIKGPVHVDPARAPSYIRSQAILLSIPFAWMTAWIIISPRTPSTGVAYDIYSWRW